MNSFKREIEILKRENARLRKMLSRAEATGRIVEDEPVFEKPARKKATDTVPETDEAKKHRCPKCNESLVEKDFGPYKYRWCDCCKYRKKIE